MIWLKSSRTMEMSRIFPALLNCKPGCALPSSKIGIRRLSPLPIGSKASGSPNRRGVVRVAHRALARRRVLKPVSDRRSSRRFETLPEGTSTSPQNPFKHPFSRCRRASRMFARAIWSQAALRRPQRFCRILDLMFDGSRGAIIRPFPFRKTDVCQNPLGEFGRHWVRRVWHPVQNLSKENGFLRDSHRPKFCQIVLVIFRCEGKIELERRGAQGIVLFARHDPPKREF